MFRRDKLMIIIDLLKSTSECWARVSSFLIMGKLEIESLRKAGP